MKDRDRCGGGPPVLVKRTRVRNTLENKDKMSVYKEKDPTKIQSTVCIKDSRLLS